MDSQVRLRQNPNVVARQLGADRGGVLLHVDTGAYHSLNAVGQVIWTLVDGERTVAEIIREVRARVSDAPPQLDDDVRAFLQGALDRDLVVATD